MKGKNKVAFFKVHPSFHPEQIKDAVDGGYKAIVIEGYACGTLPAGGNIGEYDVCPAIEYATSKRVPVFLISGSQKHDNEGFALRIRYGSQINAIKAGIIPLEIPTSNVFNIVISDLEKIVDEFEDFKVIEEKMIEKYCKPGYKERMTNTKNVLTETLV